MAISPATPCLLCLSNPGYGDRYADLFQNPKEEQGETWDWQLLTGFIEVQMARSYLRILWRRAKRMQPSAADLFGERGESLSMSSWPRRNDMYALEWAENSSLFSPKKPLPRIKATSQYKQLGEMFVRIKNGTTLTRNFTVTQRERLTFGRWTHCGGLGYKGMLLYWIL